MSSTVVHAVGEVRELPVEPLWVGIATLAILVAMLVATFVFGKGRPHA